MRSRIIFSFIILTFSLSVAPGFGEKSNTRSDELIKKIEGGDNDAILKLGNTGDKSAIPFLKKLLKEKNDGLSGSATNAQMALAKLGEEEQFKEISNEVNSGDLAVQSFAIEKLAYVGGEKSIRKLGELLSDPSGYRSKKWKGPNDEKPMDRVIYEPVRYQAARALSQIISEPVAKINRKGKVTDKDVESWRQWWHKNKGKY